MDKRSAGFEFEVYESVHSLSAQDADLLKQAQLAAAQAYAPYSRFRVGSAALLANGSVVTGSNQENASYPAGICAERTMLAAVSSLHTDPILSIAVSYEGDGIASDHPISPCGICRQVLSEYEERIGTPVRLILGGKEGEIYVIPSARSLLPLAFTSSELP
jgi:cytidine deaminase